MNTIRRIPFTTLHPSVTVAQRPAVMHAARKPAVPVVLSRPAHRRAMVIPSLLTVPGMTLAAATLAQFNYPRGSSNFAALASILGAAVILVLISILAMRRSGKDK